MSIETQAGVGRTTAEGADRRYGAIENRSIDWITPAERPARRGA